MWAPPSASSTAPISKAESGVARNRQIVATSSGFPGRRSGTCDVASAYAPS